MKLLNKYILFWNSYKIYSISFSQIEENTINVLTKSGNLYQASFDLSLGGECHKFNDIDLFKQNVEKNKE